MTASVDTNYIGRSGQRAVMAELLSRGLNVAIPEVDVGDDIFAFRDGREESVRVQVKTTFSPRRDGEPGYRVQFKIPINQLERLDSPRLVYVLAVRDNSVWTDFLVIPRRSLKRLWEESGIGTEDEGRLVLSMRFRPDGSVACGPADLRVFRNGWVFLTAALPTASNSLRESETAEGGVAADDGLCDW
jgi:hypothetical protein